MYNLISNNCQTYALQLLDAIKAGSRKEFGTTLAVYDRMFGPGKVADLFDKEHQQAADGKDSGAASAEDEENSVGLAQQVMNDNTAQLDAQEQMNKKDGERTPPKQGEAEAEQSSQTGNTDRGGIPENGTKEKKSTEVKKQLKNIFSRFSRSKSS